ncbi:hypothetical protein [Acinetobacter ursingii]|uniref:hypothetical protein n=1 Tax=Acinetobacter ursingii TaxID=108980 RepID=UPI0021CD720F|nr:hypothetical protein [Acinetobacter ursingii]MCU4483529.1 hypothetical protein [Acinetobacter ursingii]MCU4507849.1 hypothetical protein [Acinetobacter ursingii]
MSLGNEIFEWRKQMVEKLLLNGVKPEDLEKQVNAAELVVFGGQTIETTIKHSIKLLPELKATLLEFQKKNGCFLDISAKG